MPQYSQMGFTQSAGMERRAGVGRWWLNMVASKLRLDAATYPANYRHGLAVADSLVARTIWAGARIAPTPRDLGVAVRKARQAFALP